MSLEMEGKDGSDAKNISKKKIGCPWQATKI